MGCVKKKTLHLVAEIVGIQTFEPALEALLIGLIRGEPVESRKLPAKLVPRGSTGA